MLVDLWEPVHLHTRIDAFRKIGAFRRVGAMVPVLDDVHTHGGASEKCKPKHLA